MRIGIVLNRIVMLALTAAVCLSLRSKVGAGSAVVLWALGMAVLCVGTAALLHRQPVGKVTSINHLAGLIMPWGYRLGRGKLWPIVGISWLVWVCIGTAMVIAVGAYGGGGRDIAAGMPRVVESHRLRIILTTLLFLSWLVDGAVFLKLIGNAATNQRVNRALAIPIACVAGMIVVSVGLTAFVRTTTAMSLALAVSGGPPLLIGCGVGAVFLFAMTFGRHVRWN